MPKKMKQSEARAIAYDIIGNKATVTYDGARVKIGRRGWGGRGYRTASYVWYVTGATYEEAIDRLREWAANREQGAANAS